MSEPIHQDVLIDASPERVYEALTDSQQFGDFTGGGPTEIKAEDGGSFSTFGGMITGRNIELVPNQRIVQAWRVGNWPPGVYSIASFEIRRDGSSTRLVFDHSGFPEGEREHLASGWQTRYWEPLKKYLA